MTPLLILIIALVVIVLWFIGGYNGFVRGRNRVDESWADIDVQLKRRYDLIPNLIETVKGYATHEREVLEQVTEARTRAMNADQSGNAKQSAEAENMLSGTLKTLFAVSENYPDLKANENFLQLQKELADTEDKIQAARRFYNANVRDFNTRVQMFPSNVIANIFSFTVRDLYDLENAQEQRENIKVSF